MDKRDRRRAGGVVLIHGLGRSPGSMWVLARRLQARGFRTARVGYASRDLTIDQAVRQVGRDIRRVTRGWARIDLVGHSLGGVIARRIVEACPDLAIGRVVQLGAPNAGSGVAEAAGRSEIGRRFFGPALREIAELGPSGGRSRGVGAIAGRLSLVAPGAAVGLKGPNDGLVEVQSALTGAEHRLVLPGLHGFLPLSPAVSRQVMRFLEEGRFEERRR